MASVLERIRGGSPEVVARSSSSLTVDQYMQMVTQFTYDGMLYQTGNSVDPAHNFTSYVTNIHRQHNVVAACVVTRALLRQGVRYAFRNMRRGDPNYRQQFGNQALSILERPDPGVLTLPHWQATKEYHESYAGAAYTRRIGNRLEVLRPDRVDVVLAGVADEDQVKLGQAGRKIGYVYYPEGKDKPESAEALKLNEVAHTYSEPDPLRWWSGSSWVTSVIQEIVIDKAATKYLRNFFDKAATPQMIVKPHESLSGDQIEDFKEIFGKAYEGVDNAFKTLWLGGGSDVQVVGSKLGDLDLKSLQGGSETRIALRARIPAPILGIREGLQGSALNAGNYGAARRMLADGWFTPTVQSDCAATEAIIDVPAGSELAPDTADVLFLQEDAKDAAEITKIQATALQALDAAGYTADAAVKAVMSGNIAALMAEGAHDGLQSVQRLPQDTGDTNND